MLAACAWCCFLLLQMRQLRSDFSSSRQNGVTWQVLGNTVVMGPLNTPDVESAVQQQGVLAQALLNVSAGICQLLSTQIY